VGLSLTELIGYAGSGFIILSLTQKSIIKLRVFGLAGSFTFLVYSIAIAAYPIAVVNVIVASIHIWFLRKLLSKKVEIFTTLEVGKDSQYLLRFLEFHETDIAAHQYGFTYEPRDDQVRAFILRDLVPAGLFIGRVCGDSTVEVELDYVIPQYRDFKVARFLFSDRSGIFDDERGRRIWSRPGSQAHNDYFTQLGFEPEVVDGIDALVADLDVLRDANA
jgi:hypothetical protein